VTKFIVTAVGGSDWLPSLRWTQKNMTR